MIPDSSETTTEYRKNPALAFGLSLFLPGAGQHYNGQHLKGVVLEVGILGGCAMGITGAVKGIHLFGDPDPEADALGIAGLAIAGVSYLLSLIDAPFSAHEINRKLEQQSLSQPEHTLEIGFRGVDVSLIPGGIRAGISCRF